MLVALVWLVAACGTKSAPAPSCDAVRAHHDSMYTKLHRLEKGRHVMHALAVTKGCEKLDESQRRCLAGTKQYDETFACVGKSAPNAKELDFVAVATTSAAPKLVGPVDGIVPTPGWTVGSLEPKLCEKDSIIPAWCEYRAKEFPGVIFRLFRDPVLEQDGDHPLGTIRVTLPGAGVKEKLAKAWGPPRETAEAAYWFNPPIKLRVALHAAKIPGDPAGTVDMDYGGYTPLAELIGTDKRLFGFEQGKPLLGETASGIRRRFPRRIGNGRLKLWPHETGEKDLEIIFGSELESELPDKVEGFEIRLRGAAADEIKNLLEQKFGKPREDAGGLVYREKPRVVLEGDVVLVGAQDDD